MLSSRSIAPRATPKKTVKAGLSASFVCRSGRFRVRSERDVRESAPPTLARRHTPSPRAPRQRAARAGRHAHRQSYRRRKSGPPRRLQRLRSRSSAPNDRRSSGLEPRAHLKHSASDSSGINFGPFRADEENAHEVSQAQRLAHEFRFVRCREHGLESQAPPLAQAGITSFRRQLRCSEHRGSIVPSPSSFCAMLSGLTYSQS